MLVLLPLATAHSWSCPTTFSNGPCFTSARNWTEAQRTCERHGSNLVTVLNASANNATAGGCFSAAPWNDWQCMWTGHNDMLTEGTFEWASGASPSFTNWGAYEPDSGNDQDCTAICNGGSLAGYAGQFWVDFSCSDTYAFCCDHETFVLDSGTLPENSYLARLEAPEDPGSGDLSPPTPPAPPPAPDPAGPYADRRLCFSTRLTWTDARSLCESLDSHLLTVTSSDELELIGRTVHFSPVSPTWGLDWKCFWTGFNDRASEGDYEWTSRARPSYTPPFGPFEAGNGAGEEEDCVALCQSDCTNTSAPGCMDLGIYGYTGNFLIDAACTDEYSFCCDGSAAARLEVQRVRAAGGPPINKDGLVAILAVIAILAVVAAVIVIICATLSRKTATPNMNAGVTMTNMPVSATVYSPPVGPGADKL